MPNLPFFDPDVQPDEHGDYPPMSNAEFAAYIQSCGGPSHYCRKLPHAQAHVTRTEDTESSQDDRAWAAKEYEGWLDMLDRQADAEFLCRVEAMHDPENRED